MAEPPPAVYIGTSGWAYAWNEGGTLDWYIGNSGLNAVELNASFYRFPFPNQVKAWAAKGKSLHWVVKVNRLITHIYKFSEKSEGTWLKFRDLFAPLEKRIDLFLFQLPPFLTPDSAQKIERLVEVAGPEKFALEVRHERWFAPEWLDWARKLGITWVSIDAPVFISRVFRTSDKVYVRMHGRTGWYSHNYSVAELKGVVGAIRAEKPRSVYIFFNNDTGMLDNAQSMMRIMVRDASAAVLPV